MGILEMAEDFNAVEDDLPKITGKDFLCPVKFELEIQRQRILYILHIALKKMRIMAHLLFMLKNDGQILKQFLTTSELDFVIYTCNKYIPLNQNDSLVNTEGVVKYSKILDNISVNRMEDNENTTNALLGSLGIDAKVDYHISQVIEIITSNVNLVNFIKNSEEDVLLQASALIECLSHLKKLIHKRLLVTSEEQLEHEKKLRVAYKSNFVITDNIKRVQAQIDKQEKELGAELAKKEVILNSYQDELKNLQEEFQGEIMRELQKSEKQMMNDSFSCEARQIELERVSHEVANEYASLLENDLVEESQLRQKRNKMEAQLASWLTKYDNDVGEKQNELEALEKQFNDMTADYNNLMEKFNQQTEEYDILMAEKEEEEQRMFEEMAFEFLRNRSARRIQRAWRAYWQRKLERRRLKKSGKGKDKKKAKKAKPILDKKTDPNALLKKTFKKKNYLFQEMDTTKEFSTAPVEVDLTA